MKPALSRERKSLIFLIEFINALPFEDDEDLTTSFSYEPLSKYNQLVSKNICKR